MNKKLQIANELLKNTTNQYLKEFVSQYIRKLDDLESKSEFDEELLRFDSCVGYIRSSGFDITGWQLREIPVEYAHVFYHKESERAFDLDVFDIGEAVPTYIDSNSSERSANSIEEAIEKYIF